MPVEAGQFHVEVGCYIGSYIGSVDGMSKPHIGQIVLLLPIKDPAFKKAGSPTPAVVTFVHDDCCVNLEMLAGDDRGKMIPGVVFDGGPSIGKVRWDFTDGDKPSPSEAVA